MKQHETGLLWDFAGGALAPADAARVEAHLRECLVCELKLEEVRAARSVVAAPPVPPLAPERWREIDRGVAAAARRELERPRWLAALFGPPGFAFAALAAAALLLFVLWPRPGAPEVPLAQVPPVQQVPTAVAQPAPVPKPPEAAPRPEALLARVVSVRGASPLSADTPVWSGSTVSTQKKGELWLALPDGSRAGVLGDSRLKLAQLAPSELRLDLEQGTMVVDATHLEGRSFEVHAGEVDIRVTGTRFLVEHIEGRVLVAVSEGSVEVAAGERLYTVPAGRKLVVGKGAPAPGKLGPRDAQELSMLTPLPKRPAAKLPVRPVVVPRPPGVVAAADAGVASVAVVAAVDAGVVPVAVVAPAPGPDAGSEPDTEFAAYPGPNTPPPPRVVVDAGVAAAARAPAGEGDGEEVSDGGEPNFIERLLELADIDSPWPPIGVSMEQHRLRQVQRQADKGQCDRVLVRADAWLEGYEEDGTPLRAELRKQMLLTKARCLSKLGRAAEAEAVRRDREAQ